MVVELALYAVASCSSKSDVGHFNTESSVLEAKVSEYSDSDGYDVHDMLPCDAVHGRCVHGRPVSL
jgi:hypothetical protein